MSDYKPGLPSTAPKPTSSAFARVEEQSKLWLDVRLGLEIPAAKWTTQEWLPS